MWDFLPTAAFWRSTTTGDTMILWTSLQLDHEQAACLLRLVENELEDGDYYPDELLESLRGSLARAEQGLMESHIAFELLDRGGDILGGP